MGKRKDRNQELEQDSRGRLQSLFSGWVLNSLEEDYAFDFEVRTTGSPVASNTVDPSPFYVQLKASLRFDDPDSVSWDLDTDYLVEDCLQASVPVVLVLYERQRDEFYWCVLQEHCWDVLDEENEDWRDQTTVRVRVEREPLEGSRERLRSAVERTRRRISLREYVASTSRPMLDRPTDTSLASSEEVRTHKRELLDEAEALAESDLIERALEKAMQVYQMPTADECRLEAIRLLLEHRDVTDSDMGFAKLRLASEGLRLAEEREREDLQERFREVRDQMGTYLDEVFVGATYLDTESDQKLQVLRVRDWSDSDDMNLFIADVSYEVRGLFDQRAQVIAGNERYELVESGELADPLGDACAERNHEFDEDVLRDAPLLATCSNCGLSGETIQSLLHHEIPSVCDRCGDLVYDTVFVSDGICCPDCE